MTPYDAHLEQLFDDWNAKDYLWHYTYLCLNDDLKVGLPDTDTREQALINIESLIDELTETYFLIKDMDETELE